jgi:hypothetical protein
MEARIEDFVTLRRRAGAIVTRGGVQRSQGSRLEKRSGAPGRWLPLAHDSPRTTRGPSRRVWLWLCGRCRTTKRVPEGPLAEGSNRHPAGTTRGAKPSVLYQIIMTQNIVLFSCAALLAGAARPQRRPRPGCGPRRPPVAGDGSRGECACRSPSWPARARRCARPSPHAPSARCR